MATQTAVVAAAQELGENEMWGISPTRLTVERRQQHLPHKPLALQNGATASYVVQNGATASYVVRLRRQLWSAATCPNLHQRDTFLERGDLRGKRREDDTKHGDQRNSKLLHLRVLLLPQRVLKLRGATTLAGALALALAHRVLPRIVPARHLHGGHGGHRARPAERARRQLRRRREGEERGDEKSRNLGLK